MENNQNLQNELKEIKSEIQKLQTRISVIENQLNIQDQTVFQTETIRQPVEQIPVQTQQQESIFQIPNQVQQPSQRPIQQQSTQPRKKSNFETNIGKNIMSIIASILIFIGLGSFVVLIYDSMPDFIKIALMYLFSFGLSGFGYYKTTKKKNTFSTALTACGIGSTYISLLMSLVHFEIFNNITFFVLLAVWAIISLTLERKIKSPVFSIIGTIGISISVLLSTFDSIGNIEMLLLTLFFCAMSFAYTHNVLKDKGITKYIVEGIFIIPSFTLLVLLCDETLTTTIFISLTIYLIYHLCLYMYKLSDINKGNQIEYAIYLPIVALQMIFSIVNLTNSAALLGLDLGSLVCFFTLIILFISHEIFGMKEAMPITRFILTPLIFIGLLSLWFELDFNTNWFGILPLAIPFIAYFMYKKDNIFATALIHFTSIASIVTLIESMDNISFYGRINDTVTFTTEYYVFSFVSLIFLLGSLILFANKKSIQYSKSIILSNIATIFTYIPYTITKYFYILESQKVEDLLMSDFIRYLPDFLNLLILSLFVLFAIGSRYCYKWNSLNSIFNKEPNSKIEIWNSIYFKICNTILLIINIVALHMYPIGLFKLIMLLITFAQCFAGMKEILNKKINIFTGFYIGLKLTLYMNLALFAFIPYSSTPFICSILCLIIAICSIKFGFSKNIKAFRLYGLYLSIFSVFKLLLFDLALGSSLFSVFSFIFAGILCFVIVWFYNKMSENDNINSNNQNQLN